MIFGVSSTSREELERAAELAVERAAEKVAERAVEKSLDAGNSSTVTVTVKEGYSNARRTAEEDAAPGSESTRPGYYVNYQHQHYDTPNYDVNHSEESYSSRESHYSDEEADSNPEDAETYDSSSHAETEAPTYAATDFSSDLDFDFDDFGSSGGNFGMRNKRMFQGSQMKSFKTRGFASKRSIPEETDEDIFKRYSGNSKTGWTTTKQGGWTRHRPIWDDHLRQKNDDIWDDMDDEESRRKRKIVKLFADKHKLSKKRMIVDDSGENNGDKTSVPSGFESEFFRNFFPSTSIKDKLRVPLSFDGPIMVNKNRKVPQSALDSYQKFKDRVIKDPVPYIRPRLKQDNENSQEELVCNTN